MAIINVEGIRVYAYHGCLEEEGRIGSPYIVDVRMEADLKIAEKSDNLTDTIDYVKVYEIVKTQMAIRSKLIEHVGRRIFDELKKEFSSLEKAEVKVTKINPPMNGAVDKVSVTISQ
jgi:7,8-dihydroneopterin aldolase/epimerase/oxygenase